MKILNILLTLSAVGLAIPLLLGKNTKQPKLEKTDEKSPVTRPFSDDSSRENFLYPTNDPSLKHLPQRYTETTGAKEGEEYLDQFGTHHWHRKPRPFAITKSTINYQWTGEDGLKPEVMKQLANNSVMLDQLEKENAYVVKRQLVYVAGEFTEKAEEVFQGSRKELILPGPDGQEFRVQILASEGDATGDNKRYTGTFYGKIVGMPGAIVEAGADDDHWSIGIRTGDKVFEMINREHGEWILSEIDPVLEAAQDPG